MLPYSVLPSSRKLRLIHLSPLEDFQACRLLFRNHHAKAQAKGRFRRLPECTLPALRQTHSWFEPATLPESSRRPKCRSAAIADRSPALPLAASATRQKAGRLMKRTSWSASADHPKFGSYWG